MRGVLSTCVTGLGLKIRMNLLTLFRNYTMCRFVKKYVLLQYGYVYTVNLFRVNYFEIFVRVDL